MQPSQLAVNFNGMRSTLAGTVRTQQGEIYLNGDADWSQIEKLAGAGNGENGKSADHRAADGTNGCIARCCIRGYTKPVYPRCRVDVPWARIGARFAGKRSRRLQRCGGCLTITCNRKSRKRRRFRLTVTWIVHVGNNVRIDAFGLKARLTGDLNVVQDKQRAGPERADQHP